MRKFLILLIGGLSILSLEAGGSVFQWHYVWHRDQMTDKVSCVAISPKVLFSLRATGDSRFLNSWVKLVVTDSGILQIESESPFDARRSAQIGVRINDDPPDLGVSLNQTATVALFSAERSAAIIQRMLKGGSMKVQAAFFPFAELAVKDFSLTDFGTVMIQRAGCLTLRHHQGWFGAYWQPVEVPGAVFPEALIDPRAHVPTIVAFYRTHRRMPTYREIMRLAGFRSTNAAAKLVKKLVAAHLLQQDPAGRLLPSRFFAEIRV